MWRIEGTHEIGGNWLGRDDYLNRMRGYQKSLFRFQVHQVYGIPSEQPSFQEFLKTGVRKVDPNDPRLVSMRERTAAGRVSQRVQVVYPPISDYLRHAFVYFHYSARAGENLRILDTSKKSTGDLPDYDFVLLDDEVIIKLHYAAEDGSVVGRELLPEADAGEYRRYRDYALANSIPFLEYEKLIAE